MEPCGIDEEGAVLALETLLGKQGDIKKAEEMRAKLFKYNDPQGPKLELTAVQIGENLQSLLPNVLDPR